MTWINLVWLFLIFLYYHNMDADKDEAWVCWWCSAICLSLLSQDHCSLEEFSPGPARGASHQLWPGGHGPQINHWPDLQWLHLSVWVWHLHTTLPGESWAMGVTSSVLLFFIQANILHSLFVLYGICLSCPPSLKEYCLRPHIAVNVSNISGCRIKKKIPKYTLQLPGTFSILPWIRISLPKVTLRLELWHSFCKPGNVKLSSSLCLPSSLSLLSDLFSMEGGCSGWSSSMEIWVSYLLNCPSQDVVNLSVCVRNLCITKGILPVGKILPHHL